MRKIFISFLVLGLLSSNLSQAQPGQEELKGRITISGAWALYPMVVKWSEDFQKAYPKVSIDVQAGGAGKGIVDVLAGMVEIGMVSRNIYPAEKEKGAYAIPVTKDAVIPTISSKNPFLNKLVVTGIKREALIGIFTTQKITSWGEVLGTNDKASIHVYTRSDACGAGETWAEYLGGKKQEDLEGVGVYGDPGLAEAVARDPLGIGYNNTNFAYDAKTKRPVKGIMILPLDLNGNGKIDNNEGFYDTRDDLNQAIAKNVYPSPPARDLYFVMKGKPNKTILVEFVKWVLTEGQKFVLETGYIPLSQEKLAEGLKKIGEK